MLGLLRENEATWRRSHRTSAAWTGRSHAGPRKGPGPENAGLGRAQLKVSERLHLAPSATKKGASRRVDPAVHPTRGTVALTHLLMTRGAVPFTWGLEQARAVWPAQASVRAAPPVGASDPGDAVVRAVCMMGRDVGAVYGKPLTPVPHSSPSSHRAVWPGRDTAVKQGHAASSAQTHCWGPVGSTATCLRVEGVPPGVPPRGPARWGLTRWCPCSVVAETTSPRGWAG